MGYRPERVAHLLREILAGPVEEKAAEVTSGLVTLTHVRMSPDLSVAKVFISVYGGEGDPDRVVLYLNQHAGEFRRLLAPQVRMRVIPRLQFYVDDTLDHMERIQRLLRQLQEERESKDNESSDDAIG